jgi:hypothetical protein
VRHPLAAADGVRSLHVDTRREADGLVIIRYRLVGELARIRVPAGRSARIGDRLWEHTCFEAFVAGEGAAAYEELNFSPSGEWAVYRFGSYRDRIENADIAIDVRVDRAVTEVLELTAHVPLGSLSPRYRSAPLRLGVSAVIEAIDGTHSYWALHHEAGAADFHRAETWTLRLEPPTAEC